MVEAFDPYRKWLGIPPKDQPPNHYRLLGVELFEDDPDVIEAAADQRMTHVRTYQTGRNSALSQKILNELSAAKLCLLNAPKKAAYDGSLRREMTAAAPVAGPVAGSDGAVVEAALLTELDAAVSVADSALPSSRLSGAKRRNRRSWQAPAAIAAGVAIVVVSLVWLAANGSRTRPAQSAPRRASPREIAATSRATAKREARQMNTERSSEPAANSGGDVTKPLPPPDNSATNAAQTLPAVKTDMGREPAAGVPRESELNPADPTPAESRPPSTPEAQPSLALATESGQPGRGPGRLTLPNADALAKAEILIRETYQRELAGDDKAAAARSLIAAVDETSDPVERAALLFTAADVAIKAGEFPVAFEAHDELARRFIFDALAAKLKTLEDAAKTARTNEARADLANLAMKLMEEASLDARFDLAERAAKLGQTAAARVKDVALRKQIAAKRAEMERGRKAHELREKALAHAQRALAEEPDEPEANETLGKHLCFERNDWPAGLKHLAKSSPGKLRDAALADLNGPTDGQQQVNLGDDWWEIAEAADDSVRQACRRRAAFWYNLALPSLKGLLKTRAEKRIDDAGPSQTTARAAQDGQYVDIVLGPKTTLRLLRIPASADGSVRSFYLGQTEVTQRQWLAIMGSPPQAQQAVADDLPIIFVTYDQCNEFAAKLNGAVAGGWRFRLPTKEEFAHGYLAGQDQQNAYQPDPAKYGWLAAESTSAPHAVAGKQANIFGIYDILGNVWEWTSGCRYYGMSAADDLKVDPRLALALTAVPPPPGQNFENYKGWNLGFRLAADRR